MKKIALLLVLVLALSAFSLSAFADPITTAPSPTNEFTLTATIDCDFSLTIPAGTKALETNKNDAQNIGQIQLTETNATSGAIEVAITSTNSFKLKDDKTSKEIAYTVKVGEQDITLPESNTVTINYDNTAAQNVDVTVASWADASAGDYKDVMNFAVTSTLK